MSSIDKTLPLNFIGSGSAFNEYLGNNSAYIKRSTTLILIDCGGTVFHRLLQLNLLEGIKDIYIIITHMHPDHIGSLGDLLFYIHYILKGKAKIIYPDKAALSAVLSSVGASEDIYEFESLPGPIQIQNQDISLQAEPVTQNHTKSLKSFGYILKFNDKTIFYSGDSKDIQADILKKLNLGQIDLFYQDTSGQDFPENPHLYIGKLAQYIDPNLRSKVYCMHIDKAFNISQAQQLGFNVVHNSEN